MKIGFSKQMYDVLKFIAQIGLPSLGTLYFALSGIWHLPNAEQVSGTVLAIDTFLGAILGLSSKSYSPPVDGHVVVDDSDPELIGMQLNIKTPQEQIASKKSITLKVIPASLDSPPIPGPHGG